MILRLRRIGMICFFVLFVPAYACASDQLEIWNSPITRTWFDENVTAASRPSRMPSSYRLARTQVWANGLVTTGKAAFTSAAPDRTLGAKLQPFQAVDLRVGAELTRNGMEAHLMGSKASWEAYWSKNWREWHDLSLGVSTSGAVGTRQSGYTQSMNGVLGIPLGTVAGDWSTKLRFSPSMNLDTANGSIGTGLLSEVIGRTVLSSAYDEFTSVLNVSLGYGVAPDARPVASARLELRISPNL